MEKFKTIQEDIENVTNREVVKKGKISFVAIGLIGIAVVLTVTGMQSEDPNATWPSFLFTVAAMMFLGGIIKLFVSRTCWIFKPTNSKLKATTLYFDVHESDALQACIEMKRFEDFKQMKRKKDSGVRVEAMISDDRRFAAVQIAEYVPYSYEAVTPVVCYYGEDAKSFVTSFKQ